jgi:glutathione S-transferase
MLELFHWEPNAASARVLIALKEKAVDFESRFVDLLAFEQHRPEFLALNESGQVPVLVRDGEAFTDSSYICEYLDEAFPEHSLMPEAPLDRWEARAWQKYVDDHLAQAVSELAWNAYRPRGQKAPEGAPTRERKHAWEEAVAGYSDQQIAQAKERIGLAIAKVEERLAASDWLAGDAFSLADIAVFAYAHYLPKLLPDVIGQSPRTDAWLRRVADRPAVKEALAMTRSGAPFATAAPGPERVRWG